MLVIEGTYLDTVKIICEKSTVNIILNCEKLKNSPIDPEFNKNIYFYHFFFSSTVLEILARTIRQEKEIKYIHTGNVEVKLSL